MDQLTDMPGQPATNGPGSARLPNLAGKTIAVVGLGYVGLPLAVEFAAMGVEAIRALGRENAVLFDVKGIVDRSQSDGRL